MSEVALTPQEALKAVLAGRTVRLVVGPASDDPVCLHYLDRCRGDDYEPMIYTESISGWSAGVKEAICEPTNTFYLKHLADAPPPSLTITSEEPRLREAQAKPWADLAVGESHDV